MNDFNTFNLLSIGVVTLKSQMHSYSMVFLFYACAWITEMDYTCKTDRAIGYSVKETDCTSKIVYICYEIVNAR